MAQISFTTLPALATDDLQQSIDLHGLMHSTVTIYKYDEVQDNSIVVDEGDVFQCGKCGKKFCFSEFVLHKKNTCSGPRIDLINSSIPESYHIESLDTNSSNGARSLILEASSFSLESGGDGELNVTLDDPTNRAFAAESVSRPITPTVDLKQFSLVDGNSNFEVNSELQDHFLPGGHKAFLPLTNDDVPSLDGFYVKGETCLGSVRGEPPELPVDEGTSKEVNTSTGKSVARQLKCSYCNKEFKKSFDLKQHLRSHTGERPFLCVVCGRAFAQRSNVIKHMSTHKVWPKKNVTIPSNPFHAVPDGNNGSGECLVSADISSFSCQYCSAVMPTYVEWRSHLKVHKEEKVFQCIQHSCGLTFSDVDSFLTHIRTHHRAQYSCHSCLETFPSLNKLGTHKCAYNNNNKVIEKTTCKKCGVKYVRGKEHVCNIFPCLVCARSFHSERFLRRHLPVHNSATNHLCTECNKAFKSARSLTHHKIVHSNLRPFVCRVCSRAFSRREKLVRHCLIHESVKKFKCPFLNSLGCTKEFTRKDKLKDHVVVHDSNRSKVDFAELPPLATSPPSPKK